MTGWRGPAEVEQPQTVGRFDRSSWISQVPLLVVALIVALGALVRQTGVPTFATIWAEDGQVFAQCGLSGAPAFDCLTASYDGWIHFVPRLLAMIATALDPALLAVAIAGLAALAAAACGYLVARAVRGATGSIGAAVIAGTSLTLIQVSAVNVGGTLANLHWILIAASCTVLIQAWLGHPFDALDGALVVLTVLSSPFGLLLVGLAGIGVVLGRPRMRLVAGLLLIGALIQLSAAMLGARIPLPDATPGRLSLISWFARYIVNGGVFAATAPVPNWIVSGTLAAIVAWLFVQAVLVRGIIANVGIRAYVTAAPVVRLLAVLAMFGSGLAVLVGSAVLNHHAAPRHTYDVLATMVIALAVGLGLISQSGVAPEVSSPDRASPPRWQPLVAVGAIVFAIGFGTSFWVADPASVGPSYPEELAAMRAECATADQTIILTISPLSSGAPESGWSLRIPCVRLLP